MSKNRNRQFVNNQPNKATMSDQQQPPVDDATKQDTTEEDQSQDTSSEDTSTEQGSQDQGEGSEHVEGSTDHTDVDTTNEPQKETVTLPATPFNKEEFVEKVVADVEAQDPVQEPEAVDPVKTLTPHEESKLMYKIEISLTAYAEAMDKNKSINPAEGGKWQFSLFNSIMEVLNNTNQENFTLEWNTMLAFFYKNKDGIFNDHYIYRFPEMWPGSTSQFATYRRLVYLIMQTADARSRRAALRDINMAKVVEGMTQPQVNRLNSFYGS